MNLVRNKKLEVVFFRFIGVLLHILMIGYLYYCSEHYNKFSYLIGALIIAPTFYLYFFCEDILHDEMYQKIFAVIGVITGLAVVSYVFIPNLIWAIQAVNVNTIDFGDIVAWAIIQYLFIGGTILVSSYLFVVPPALCMVINQLLKKQKIVVRFIISFLIYSVIPIFLIIKSHVV